MKGKQKMIEKKNQNWLLKGEISLAVLIVLFSFIYFVVMPKGNNFDKTITIEVIRENETLKEVIIETNAKTLREACDEKKLIEGTESEYGLFVLTVDGITVDESKQQWWSITKNKQMVNTGVDSTVIADGEHYEFTLTTGY
jgi:hypothetical protein